MVNQIANNITYAQNILQMVNSQLETCSKEEIVDLVFKLFCYGRHLGVSPNTYNKKSILARRGFHKSNGISWMQIELVDEEKLQKRKVETVLVFYAERTLSQEWFVSYLRSGGWIEELKSVVNSFEGKCFCSI